MSKTAIITARVDSDTLALIDRVSAAQGQTRAAFAARAIQRVAEAKADWFTAIQAGIDAANRGDVVPHGQVMAELEAMIAKRRGRCPS